MPSAYPGDDDDAGHEPAVPALTAEQAAALRAQLPALSLWQVLAWQFVAGFVVAVTAYAVSAKPAVLWSAAYGAVAVWVPACLFARAWSRNRLASQAGAALAGFFVWELVKIALTIALLLAAPRLVDGLDWLALLAGFVVTMKASWWALWWQSLRRKSVVTDLDK